MVMPFVGAAAGAAARAGAKKLAEKGVKKVPKRDNRDENLRDAIQVGLHGGSAAGATAMALGQEDRIKKAEANKAQQEREAEAEMKRETRGMKKGGKVHDDVKKDKPMMEKVAKKAVKGHEARMHKTKKMMGGGMTYKKGGSIDGCATKGKTKGKQVKMASGGKC